MPLKPIRMPLRGSLYGVARRRLRPQGLLVAKFAGLRRYWPRLLALLDEAYEARAVSGAVPGGDNRIKFAFSESGCSLVWERLEGRAEALADRFPHDYSALVHSLRERAELRWAKKVSCQLKACHS